MGVSFRPRGGVEGAGGGGGWAFEKEKTSRAVPFNNWDSAAKKEKNERKQHRNPKTRKPKTRKQ